LVHGSGRHQHLGMGRRCACLLACSARRWVCSRSAGRCSPSRID